MFFIHSFWSLGYCMFGNAVSEEFSQDLFATPGYNGLLNKIALYALVITPMQVEIEYLEFGSR